MSPPRMLGLVGILGALVVLPALFLDTERYAAYGTAAQAFGVFLALVLAVVTLRSQEQAAKVGLREQVRIDRVSRTLNLHELFTTGEVNQARGHLIDHLRLLDVETRQGSTERSQRGGPVETASLADLRNPIGDAYALLWYFERAEAALGAGLLDEGLFHKLLGRHIVWWDHAICRDTSESMRGALERLGDWVWRHAETHPAAAAYSERWKVTLAWGFPHSDYAATISAPSDD